MQIWSPTWRVSWYSAWALSRARQLAAAGAEAAWVHWARLPLPTRAPGPLTARPKRRPATRGGPAVTCSPTLPTRSVPCHGTTLVGVVAVGDGLVGVDGADWLGAPPWLPPGPVPLPTGG